MLSIFFLGFNQDKLIEQSDKKKKTTKYQKSACSSDPE